MDTSISASSSGYPLTLSWDNQNLPFGSFFLQDVIAGNIVNIDMKLESSFTLTNESTNKLNIVYKEVYTSTISNNENWDLISIPLKSEIMEINFLFSGASSNAFYFDGSYISTQNLENGKGYWLKFNKDNTTNIYGGLVTEPIIVTKGWNLIGGYNEEISSSSIAQTQAG